METEKIPDYILLNRVIKENTRLKQEVEDLRKDLKVALLAYKSMFQLSPEDKMEIKRGEFYISQKKKIAELGDRIRDLKKDNTKLLQKLVINERTRST